MPDLNAIFNEFARAFAGTINDGKEIALPAALDRKLLDESLESLHVVDRYLDRVHERREELTAAEWNATVLRTGAYLGEVIRNLAPEGEFRWVDYNDYIPQHPKLQKMIPERNIATCAFLVHRSGAMSMPINKIARYIEEGAEHNVHFFAQCDLKRVKPQA